jgi:hypothetical protein
MVRYRELVSVEYEAKSTQHNRTLHSHLRTTPMLSIPLNIRTKIEIHWFSYHEDNYRGHNLGKLALQGRKGGVDHVMSTTLVFQNQSSI